MESSYAYKVCIIEPKNFLIFALIFYSLCAKADPPLSNIEQKWQDGYNKSTTAIDYLNTAGFLEFSDRHNVNLSPFEINSAAHANKFERQKRDSEVKSTTALQSYQSSNPQSLVFTNTVTVGQVKGFFKDEYLKSCLQSAYSDDTLVQNVRLLNCGAEPIENFSGLQHLTNLYQTSILLKIPYGIRSFSYHQ